jgi:subtilisin family serine protease
MATRSVIVEYRADPELDRQATTTVKSLEADRLAHLLEVDGVPFDLEFAPVRLPAVVAREPGQAGSAVVVDPSPERATYLLRAEVDGAQIEALRAHDGVVGVFSDPVVERCLTCIDSPPLGTAADVEALLGVADLRACAIDGSGVLVAIVDTGLNLEYLEGKGKTPKFLAEASWGYGGQLPLGSMPVDHGTMCAFDVCIGAPACTLIDVALLRPFGGGMQALLSDAVRAYSHLRDVLTGRLRPADLRGLVVSNSWGMFHPSWDLPPGDAGNYSDNPNHPFNRAVGALEALGADILFAAGNCGPQCPDSRCQDVSDDAIYGANGHPAVLSVAGVDTARERVGYSAIGPGRLAERKPDISGYTHFKGSEVFESDAGTSAACPVVAGIVAAVRSKRALDPADADTSPAAIRGLVTSTARDLGAAGYDAEHGYGVVDAAALADLLCDGSPGEAP